MATEPQGNGENAGEAPQAISVLAQYIKDLSFENPNAPRSMGNQATSPQITLQVNVNGKPLSGQDYEVELSIEGGAGEARGPCSSSSCSTVRCCASPAFRRTASTRW